MNRYKSISRPLMWFMAILLAALAAGCGGDGGTGSTADTTPPTVTVTVPADAATGVMLNSNITATFSESMNAATITSSTFTLRQGASAIAGSVTLSGTTATFNPASDFAAGTVYTATVTTAVKDVAGNAMTSNKVWTFTTVSATDITAPTVSSTVPLDVATGVPLNSNITATFSEVMNAGTISPVSFTLMQGASAVPGTVTYAGVTATFNPASNLAASTVYTATVTTAAKDMADNALAVDKVWTFTTGTTTDSTAPTVSSVVPLDVATGVPLNTNVTANFSEVMDAATISGTTFTLQQGTTAIPGVVTYAGSTATFNPASDLAASTVYTATVTTAVKDMAGNALATNKVWTFTTGTTAAAGPAAVDLLSAGTGNFVILSRTGVTSTGSHASAIIGNIGASPIAASAMTSVFCSEITGTIYGVDATYVGSGDQSCFAGTPADKTTVDNAVADMGIAYADAAGRTLPDGTNLGTAGEIGGLTFTPGLYKWTTDVTITTDVTLTGGASDVWIFQIAGNLNVAAGASVPAGIKVTLSGGAVASNVFWQVGGGTGATLGTYSTFNGNILSATQVIMQTGAVLHGRALAQTAVTLDANPVGP